MTDWRTKPRTGKSQIYPLLPEIQNRMALGETCRQMHDALTAQERIKIGYDQFSRYVRTLLKSEKTKQAQPPKPIAPVVKPDFKAHPFNFGNQPQNDGERRRELDKDFHSSVPDRERIYGPSKDADRK